MAAPRTDVTLFCQIQRQITLHTRHSGGHVLAAVNDGLAWFIKFCCSITGNNTGVVQLA